MQIGESKKLREIIKKDYKLFHQHGVFDGATYKKYLSIFSKLIPNIENKSILDYGCGIVGGLRNHFKNVYPYDPYVKNYTKFPDNQKFDIIFSSDVLEHLLFVDILGFIRYILHIKPQYIFLTIALRSSSKEFTNSLNIHLTVEPAYWWYGLFQGHLGLTYKVIYAKEDLLTNDLIICFKSNA